MDLDFSKSIILENERVRIEPLILSHYNLLTHIVVDNPDLLRYSPAKFGTLNLLKEYIENNVLLRGCCKKYPFVIFDKECQEYAGSTSFLNISNKDERLEIGSTWIGEKYQKTGLNRNCKLLLMTYAFEELKAVRLEFKTDGRNKQSQKAIEGIGAKYEGILRSHTVMPDGYRRDTVYYSVLKDEWNGVKGSFKY